MLVHDFKAPHTVLPVVLASNQRRPESVQPYRYARNFQGWWTEASLSQRPWEISSEKPGWGLMFGGMLLPSAGSRQIAHSARE